MNQITEGQSTEMNLYGPDAPNGERGALVLHVVIHHLGTAISLLFTHHSVMNRQLPVDEARAYLADIQCEAKRGTALWAIEEFAGAWTTAASIVDQAILDGIRANMEAMQPKPVDVSDIHPNWSHYQQADSTTAALTSAAMDRVLASAVNGYIERSAAATSMQLVRLKARGLVELAYTKRGNQRVIAGAYLTAKGAKKVAA